MQKVSIRNAAAEDFAIICALNLAEVQHTSPMDAAHLGVLAALACYCKVACVADRVAAFLLAMRDGAPYENDNYGWFARRHAQFIYIDRIVVSPEFKGLRIGTLLYEDLFSYAREHGIGVVTCEYNIQPPNEASRIFHDKFGFKEQGTQWAAGGAKRVSLQAAPSQPVSVRI